MARLVSGRVKRTPQVSISSERYEFLSLEESEPNLGDPTVGPSSVGVNPFPVGTGYILVASPTNPGKRYWSLPQNISGIGIVTFAENSGTSINVDGGVGILTSLSVSGLTTITAGVAATTYSTGTLVVDGGVGISSNLIVNDNLSVNGVFVGQIGSGEDNFFIGIDAGRVNTTGNYNLFFGTNAGYNNTVGNSNIFFGLNSGRENFDGINNTFLGQFSGFNNYSGSFNIFIGKGSGNTNQDGSYNIFLGDSSGFNNEYGDNNVFIGKGAAYLNSDGSNNVAIGNSVALYSPTVNNNLAIGVGDNHWIYGNSSYNVGFGTNLPTEKVDVVGTVKASGGFISVGNTTPIQISLIGNELTFTAVGIGSTTFTLV
jgi:hypothetical protein